jgi:glycine/D-amino acid oxidase-like deaminating enzyme
MGDLTKNFSTSEFACKCGCGLKYPAPALFRTIQEIRDWLQRPVSIVSGWRCAKHNRDEGSKVLGKQGFYKGQAGDGDASAHTRGEAADIKAEGLTRAELYDAVVRLHQEGKLPELRYVYAIKKSQGNVHIGVDAKPRKSPYGGEQ